MIQSKAWVFKINTRRGWEFDQYFRSPAGGPYGMGEGGWIRSASSLRYLREEVKRGDVFLCYEVDRKRLVGLARAASDGHDQGAGSLLDFCPPRQAFRLSRPLKRRPGLDHILAFTPQRGRGTVQKIAGDEFRCLLTRILKENPSQKDDLRRFLKASR
ncbi:MAG: hypothetical protein ACRD11_06955 [Terriglobia bacterium]